MLQYFAASEHTLYAKYLYLKMMQELPKTQPDVCRIFQEGYHVMMRSNHYWAGLSTYLIIVQVLLRSGKTSGGLTIRTGMTEKTINVSHLFLPLHAHVVEVMQELFGVRHETREQHKEVSKAKQGRDVNDTLDIISYLIDQSPFTSDPVLHSLANDMTAES